MSTDPQPSVPLHDLDYVQIALDCAAFLEPALRQAMCAIPVARGSCGLDAACGPGGPLSLLAEYVGPLGKVVGVDISKSHLESARTSIHLEQVEIHPDPVDLSKPLPFPPDHFDWVWSANAISPLYFRDPGSVVRELGRVAKPGATVALFRGDWLRATLLRGYRELEQRFYSVFEANFDRKAKSYFGPDTPSFGSTEDMVPWFHQAGLRDIRVESFLIQHRHPLPSRVRRYMEATILGSHLRSVTEEDAMHAGISSTEWKRCLSEWETVSRHIFDSNDYHCSQTGTLTLGRVPD